MTSARGIAAVSAAIFACLLPAAAPAAARHARTCGATALAGGGARHPGGGARHHGGGARHHHHHHRHPHHNHRRHRARHRRGASAGVCSTRRSSSPLIPRSHGGGRGFFTPVLLPARIASTVSPPSDGSSPQAAASPKSSPGAAGAGAPEGGTSAGGGAGRPGESPAAEERPAEEAPAPPVEETPPPVVEEVPAPPAEEQAAPPVEEVIPPTEEAPAPPAEEAPTPPTEEAPTPPAEEVPAPPSGESSPSAEEEPTPGAGASEPFRFFSPTSFWNQAPPANAAIDPNSAAIVGALAGEVAHEEEIKKGPAINTTAWSVPVYTVPANQPTVKVTLPYASLNPTLQAAWEAVPLPADAKPATGTDKHLVVWQASSDKLWEFWHLEDKPEVGWEAYWGGATQNVSSASGAYGPEAWPGAKTGWGASASSLSIAGGLITLEDLEKGTINHALAIAVPNTRAKVFATPAQRTDGGSSEATSLPEGAHLRLNPHLDLAALHLPHLTLLLAEAAQRYGIVVRDTAANVALYAQDPTPTGVNPYTGKTGYYEGKSPAQLLAVFPWSELQLLKMELHP